jgi:tripartite-type tricarboxylate transporter receptor subunit TctC
LLGEHLTAVIASYPNLTEQIRSGRLRPLASASASRFGQMPDVPTLSELGFKDIEADIWFGVAAPAKTPADSVAQLVRWFAAALQHPDIQSKLAAQGLFSVGMCGGDFAAFLRKQSETYGSAIRASNIQAN